MPKPEKCPSNNPKDIEFFIKGWNEGQKELETAVLKWIAELEPEDKKTFGQSLLSAMEHS